MNIWNSDQVRPSDKVSALSCRWRRRLPGRSRSLFPFLSVSLWECERTNRPGSESKPVSIMDQIKAANTWQLRVCGCHGRKRSCMSLSFLCTLLVGGAGGRENKFQRSTFISPPSFKATLHVHNRRYVHVNPRRSIPTFQYTIYYKNKACILNRHCMRCFISVGICDCSVIIFKRSINKSVKKKKNNNNKMRRSGIYSN